MSTTDPALGVARGWLPGAPRLSARMVDHFEQVVLVALYALLVWRMLPGSVADASLYTWLLLASEGTVVAFVLIRRPTQRITVRPVEWSVAFAGTLAPLLVSMSGTPLMPQLGVALIMAGWFIHLGAKLTLRRSFGVVAADRGLKTDGFYAIVRHPMYMGYLITHIGFLLTAPSLWNAVCYGVAWVFMVRRMRAEEEVLGGNAAYGAYRAKVRHRLVPGVW